MGLLRIDKLLCTAVGCTRTEAKKLLSSGAVTVDGKTVKSGSDKADPELQAVCIDGKPISYSEHSYIIMNKPLGVVSATEDRESRTVIDILPKELLRKGLFPAGRLDKYTEGMMIITDDGAFAHNILAPKKHLPKIYEFTLDAPILSQELVNKFKKGIYLGGGEYSSPAALKIFSSTQGKVMIFEGIYHQVRRMFDQNGGKVVLLKRTQIGGFSLPNNLSSGSSRLLTSQELEKLFSVPPDVDELFL